MRITNQSYPIQSFSKTFVMVSVHSEVMETTLVALFSQGQFNLQFYSFCNVHGSLQVQMCTLEDELVDKTHKAGTSLIQLSFRSLACMDIAMDSALHIASSCFHF
jgi:hypothetical protein